MANPHKCETFDFPLANGPINYKVTKKIIAKAGGTWQIAEQEAIDEAKQQADLDGKAALKNDTCAAPCESFIYVDTSITNIAPVWAAGKKGKVLDITITGTWQAGILCFKPAEKDKDKDDDKDKKSGSGEKGKDKDEKKKKKKKKGKDAKPGKAAAEKRKDKDSVSAVEVKAKAKAKGARRGDAKSGKANS